jgi:hypothetical protein
MTFCELAAVIVIRVLSALLDDDWAAAALHDWQGSGQGSSDDKQQRFLYSLFHAFPFKSPGPRSFARLVWFIGLLVPRSPGSLSREVLADEEVARYRSLHVMGQPVRRFVYVVAPKGSLVAILNVLIGLSICRPGVHELHRHVVITCVDQHPFRLGDGHRLAIRSSGASMRTRCHAPISFSLAESWPTWFFAD